MVGVAELQLLRHHVNQHGVSPPEDQVQVMREYPKPITIRQLWGVPWHSELFHWFVPQCAQILTPLNSILKTTPSNSDVLQWTSEATAAFQDIKNTLADTFLLVHPKLAAPVKLMTDVSDIAIGGVLQQYLNDTWCPLTYFSRKLTRTGQKYRHIWQRALSSQLNNLSLPSFPGNSWVLCVDWSQTIIL